MAWFTTPAAIPLTPCHPESMGMKSTGFANSLNSGKDIHEEITEGRMPVEADSEKRRRVG